MALALGIGVNNTVFTCVNAVFLRGLPFKDSQRIMHLSGRNLAEGQEELGVSYPDFEDWRVAVRTFSELGAFNAGTMNVSDAARPPGANQRRLGDGQYLPAHRPATASGKGLRFR